MKRKVLSVILIFMISLSFMTIQASKYGFALREKLSDEYLPGDIIYVNAITGASNVNFRIINDSGLAIYYITISNAELKEEGVKVLVSEDFETTAWDYGSYKIEISAGEDVIFSHLFNVVETLSEDNDDDKDDDKDNKNDNKTTRPEIPYNNNQRPKDEDDETSDNLDQKENKIIDVDIDKINLKFTDVDNVPWAIEAIKVLSYKGIINGMDEKTFAPNEQVTRAQFMVMLVNALEIKASGNTPSFADVKKGQWYTDAVNIASSRGIIKGYDDGNFGINDPILRQDMAVVISRAAEVVGKKIPKKYAKLTFIDDLYIANYAKESVYMMQEAGIISGVGQNIFAPTSTATRAQAAKIIYELMKI